MKRRARKIKS